jgi:hypothetical protein
MYNYIFSARVVISFMTNYNAENHYVRIKGGKPFINYIINAHCVDYRCKMSKLWLNMSWFGLN